MLMRKARRWNCAVLLALLGAWSAIGSAQPAADETNAEPATIASSADWVHPAYPATKPSRKRITVINRYPYRVAQYDPPFGLVPVPAANADYSTPETMMQARVSAMTALDYDWWLNTWDAPSRQLVLEHDKAMNLIPQNWLDRWGVFSVARVTLQRRIETGDYVILTYSLLAPSGQDVGGLEFPAVLRKVENRWFSTQDLMRDPLAPYSPWVSGKNQAEETVR